MSIAADLIESAVNDRHPDQTCPWIAWREADDYYCGTEYWSDLTNIELRMFMLLVAEVLNND